MGSTRQPAARGSLFLTLRALFAAFAAFPLMRLHVMATPAGQPSARVLRTWTGRLLRWSGFDVTIDGVESLVHVPCALFVANHASVIDSALLLAVLPAHVRFVANHRLGSRPFLGAAVRQSGHLLVDRGYAASRAACARDMIAALERGVSLVVFPEGTRADGAMQPFQIGPFRIARAAGRPIVPLAIQGTREVLPRRIRLLRRAPITLTVLPTIESGTATTAADLRDDVARAIAACLSASAPSAT